MYIGAGGLNIFNLDQPRESKEVLVKKLFGKDLEAIVNLKVFWPLK